MLKKLLIILIQFLSKESGGIKKHNNHASSSSWKKLEKIHLIQRLILPIIGLYLDNQDSQVRMMVLGRKLHPMKWIGFFLYFCIWNLSKLVSIIDTGARFAGKVLHGTWPVQNNPWYNAYCWSIYSKWSKQTQKTCTLFRSILKCMSYFISTVPNCGGKLLCLKSVDIGNFCIKICEITLQ